jgi:glycine/D-amino acid oxidase-like deaminating enzyme
VSPTSSPDELRKELAAEREQLGAATRELKAEVDELKRKLPKVAAVVAATGVAILVLRRIVSR